MIKTANAPIFGVNLEGEVTEWNDKAAVLSGFSREEALGEKLVDTFISPQYKNAVAAAIKDACNGIDTTNFEFPLIHRDGSEILVLLNATSRRDYRGKIVGMIGVGQDISTLSHAVKEFSRIADDLRRIIEFANAPIFGIDTEGRVTEWNEKVAEISGWTKDEMVGQLLIDTFIAEEYQQEVGRVLADALEGIETANYEFPLFNKDGSRRDVLFNATTRTGADGKVTGVIGVGQDITEFRAVSREHHKLADDLSRLIETANAPIFGVDREGRVTEWNRKAAEISGYTKAETSGQKLVKHFIHHMYQRSVQNVLDKALQAKEVANFEFPLYTKSGERRDVLLNATPRWNANGEVIGVVGVGQDITELNCQRREAEALAADLSRIIHTANAPIFGVNCMNCITEWNGWMADSTGFCKEEVIGRKLSSFIKREFRTKVVDTLRDTCQGKITDHFEVQFDSRAAKGTDENNITLLLSATLRRSAQGDVIGLICVGQDISRLKELEEKKLSFMALVSHELKSPLHGIIGLSTSLITDIVKEPLVLRPLQMIHGCATRLLDILTNIMDTSSLVREKRIRLSLDTVQMQDIIDEVCVLCQHSRDKRDQPLVKPGVELINNVKEPVRTIEADAHRCIQLIYNLVTNALKFTHEGHVSINAYHDDEHQMLCIDVEDTGIGIASENIDRVFEPFDQEDMSGSRMYEGLGLGLAICRRIAAKHGGTLTAESEKDKGSIFHVRLPYCLEYAVQSPDAMSVYSGHSINRPKDDEDDGEGTMCRSNSIPSRSDRSDRFERSTSCLDNLLLARKGDHFSAFHSHNDLPAHSVGVRSVDDIGSLGTMSMDLDELKLADFDMDSDRTNRRVWNIFSVDDDEVNQEVMRTTLDVHQNYKVYSLPSGTECLRMIFEEGQVPDLILLDLMMPGPSGLDVVTQLRRTFTLIRLPIIMVSAKNSTSAVIKGLSLGCNDWVHKPFDRHELLARVKVHLKIREELNAQFALRVHKSSLSKIFPHYFVDRICGRRWQDQDIPSLREEFLRHLMSPAVHSVARSSGTITPTSHMSGTSEDSQGKEPLDPIQLRQQEKGLRRQQEEANRASQELFNVRQDLDIHRAQVFELRQKLKSVEENHRLQMAEQQRMHKQELLRQRVELVELGESNTFARETMVELEILRRAVHKSQTRTRSRSPPAVSPRAGTPQDEQQAPDDLAPPQNVSFALAMSEPPARELQFSQPLSRQLRAPTPAPQLGREQEEDSFLRSREASAAPSERGGSLACYHSTEMVAPSDIPGEFWHSYTMLQWHNAHLQAELSTKGELLVQAQAQLQFRLVQEKALRERCDQLEHSLRHLEVDVQLLRGFSGQ